MSNMELIKSAELATSLRNDLPCCPRRMRALSSKKRLREKALGAMSDLVVFENLLPHEFNLNEAHQEKRSQIFATYYNFGAKLYECLRTIAIDIENESDGFSTKAIATVLKMLKLEHFRSSDEGRLPPVSDLLDILQSRKLDDNHVLFKISDLLRDVKSDKNVENYAAYDSSDPNKISVNLAAEAMTSVASMAHCFLATLYAEERMKASNPDGLDYDSMDDDEIPGGGENDGNDVPPAKPEKKEAIVHYRKLPSIEPISLQQNAILLLATRLGIEKFLDMSIEIGKQAFEGKQLCKVTPLMEASASSNFSIVRKLLELGADPNVQSVPNCNTALIYAAATNDRNTVREILSSEGPIKADVYKVNNHYHDAMMEVALVGGTATINEFLEKGHKPKFLHAKEDMRFLQQESALTLAAYKGHIGVVSSIMDFHEKNPPQTDEERTNVSLEMYSALMEAAMDGHTDVCKLMICRGTPTDMLNPYSLESPLTLACSGGYPDVVDILLSAGAKIEEMNEDKNTPLMEACREGHADVVKVLLSRHANVNALNPDLGDTPLSLAAGGGFIDIMKMLIEKGADLTIGTTSPIVEAAQEGKLECVQFILAHSKAIPQDQLSRALVAAADHGTLAIVEELVRAGADLNFEYDDRTALMKAAKGEHFDIVQLLISKGASINFKSSKNDATALSLACSEGNAEIAQFLIRNGADPMLKMDDGVNCFMEVARHGSCDLMNMLVEFTKGNMPIDKEPPKLGTTKCKPSKFKKRKGMPLASDMMMMLNGIYPSKKKSCKHPTIHDMPYSTHEVDMLTHLLKLQQQMVSYEAPGDEGEVKEIKEALRALESVYGVTNEGKINFPAPPNRHEMDKLYNGELVPNIKQWAELVSHGWLEMERMVGKPIELSSFLHCNEGHTTNAAAAVSAAAAAATGMDSQTYLASVFAKMNNGEEMPRVPATVGSLNAASAAMTGISFHSDEAMRLFGGASFANKMISENKKLCNHSHYASVHPVQESAFRAALLKMGSTHKERKGAAISISEMRSNFPIEDGRTKPVVKPPQPVTPPQKSSSITVAKTPATPGAVEVTTEQPTSSPSGSGGKVAIPEKKGMSPSKAYPGIIKLAGEMEKQWRKNPTESNREMAVLTAYIASTLPGFDCNELDIESGERLLKKIFAGMSEEQKQETMEQAKETVNSGTGSEILRRSLDALTDKRLKEEYLKLFRESAECAFYDQCIKESNQQIKAVEQKPKSKALSAIGGSTQSPSKSQMAKTIASQQQQQGQLRRTHSEGDGAERAKTRSNAIDKATETTLETPLTIACANGHKEIVELLLKEGANIEHRDKKGFSPLIIAATAGHASVVEVLLKNHAAIEAQSDRTKDTALSLACSGGRKEVVDLLLAHGANKEHRNVSDYTPLSLASSGGYIDIVNMLLDAGSEINSRTGSKLGISPLMLAAMNGHREATKVLLEKGSDINAQIETNRNTALTLASFQGRTEVVKLLLDYQANVEHRAKTGLTPLMECASGGYVDVGKMLIASEADPNAAPVPSSKDTALTIAADKGHEKFVRMLLDSKALVDSRNKKGCTALWLACNGGHLSTVKALIEKGADPDTFDNRKISPMMAAFRKGYVDIVKTMVETAKQFPNEQDLARTQQTAESEEIRKKCGECIEVIKEAKEAQAANADQRAEELLKFCEAEETKAQVKKAKQQEKKKKKKEAKKAKQDVGKAEDEPELELEPELEPEPEPEPEPVPEPIPEPEPEPPAVVTPEPPKEPPKPRRNRKKTNPNGLPKEPKPVVKEEKIDEEPAEMPFKPIVVTIPPPAQVHAPLVSPGSYSESEEWCKAGKEGKKAKPTKKSGSQVAPSSAGSSQAKESSTTSSVASDHGQAYEIDTKMRKHWTLNIHGLTIARVIGRSGSNINAVREATGALIEIEKLGTRKDQERQVLIRGNPDAVKNAVAIIQLLIADADILINDAIRTILRGNSSVASSVSSEGTSKSAVDSAPFVSASIPPGVSNATSKRQSSPAPHQMHTGYQQSSQKFSKQHGHQYQNQQSKDQSGTGGGNVWQQRMAARQEVEKVPTPVAQQPSQTPTQPQSVPPTQRAQPQQQHQQQQQPIVAPEPVRQTPAPFVPTQTPTIPDVATYTSPSPLSAMDRVIAPPVKRDPVAAVVQPVQQARPEQVLQPRISEAIQRLPDPISRPAPGTLPQSPIQTHSQPPFSKAPGSRPSGDFSRAVGAPAGTTSVRNDIFEEPSCAFGQFKPTSSSATTSNLLASTSSFPPPVEETNGNVDNFDFTKLRMFDDAKIDDIWSSKPETEESSAWGGLFSQFLTPSNSNALNTTNNTTNNAAEPLSDWGNDFMSLLGAPSIPNSSSNAPAPPVPQANNSANPGLASLELKGWMPATFAQSARDPNRAPAPLFSRPQANPPPPSSLQQQQLQQLQQHQQQQQAMQQQQQRLQQYQQQFQQQQHSPQSSLSDVHPMNSKFAMLQQQHLYNQMQSMGPDQHGSNIYSQRFQLAAQLLTHQEGSSTGPTAHAGSSSNQLANSYYPSPSYTDSSVLGQLNMSSMSQRGIKQFDGFNNDSSSADSLIAALMDQQKKNASAQNMQQSGFMHSNNQPSPFGTSGSNLPNQSRLGMMQSRQQPPPFVAPQPPVAPPGFSSLSGPSASNAPSSSSTRSQMYPQFQQPQQQMPYNQLSQMDWNRQLGGQLGQQSTSQQQQQNQQPPAQPSNKWPPTW